MNWGLVLERDAEQVDYQNDSEDMTPTGNKYGRNMYHFVATSDLPADYIKGKDVLEVGSGRGRGALYVARALGPRRYVGLDLQAENVRLAASKLKADNLEFIEGS